jgi:hypothetical protein
VSAAAAAPSQRSRAYEAAAASGGESDEDSLAEDAEAPHEDHVRRSEELLAALAKLERGSAFTPSAPSAAARAGRRATVGERMDALSMAMAEGGSSTAATSDGEEEAEEDGVATTPVTRTQLEQVRQAADLERRRLVGSMLFDLTEEDADQLDMIVAAHDFNGSGITHF